MDNRENIKIKKKAAILSVVVGILLFGVKLVVLYLTGSTAVYSDAAESVVHIVATLFALYSIYLAAKPPDKSHLYGHGNIEYFSAGIEGMLIIVAAVAIFYEAIINIINNHSPENLGVGMIILIGISLTNLLLGFYLIKRGKETNSLILTADGKHILTDSATTLGVFLGLMLVNITGVPLIDPIFAMFVATNIIYTGVRLIRQSISGLMLEANPEKLEKIVSRLLEMRSDKWIDIHQLRFWESAEKTFIDFHLILPYYLTIKEAHEIEDAIADGLKKLFEQCEVRIHHDFCNYKMCKYCPMKNCSVRKEPQSVTIEWTIEKLIAEPLDDLRNH